MAEYIEKQEAIESALAAVPRDEYYDRQIEVFINLIPPADVRPVVLCGQCQYSDKVDEYELWCTGFCQPARLVRPDDFCSVGEEATS